MFDLSLTYPLLNFLNGGLITALLLTTQCLPILTLAKSPRITQSVIIMVCNENYRKIWNLKKKKIDYH